MSPDSAALIEQGRRVLRLESLAVEAVAHRLDERFARAVELLAKARGRVIVSGVGKSGLIARKIAATLTSTGTAATYLHPIDSLHGDLGIVGREDIAIVLSKSGESQDLFGLVGSLQRLGVPIIAITGESRLHPWPGGRRGARWLRHRGGLSPRPRPDREYHGRLGPGRRARRGIAGSERDFGGRILPRSIRAEGSAVSCSSGYVT